MEIKVEEAPKSQVARSTPRSLGPIWLLKGMGMEFGSAVGFNISFSSESFSLPQNHKNTFLQLIVTEFQEH